MPLRRSTRAKQSAALSRHSKTNLVRLGVQAVILIPVMTVLDHWHDWNLQTQRTEVRAVLATTEPSCNYQYPVPSELIIHMSPKKTGSRVSQTTVHCSITKAKINTRINLFTGSWTCIVCTRSARTRLPQTSRQTRQFQIQNICHWALPPSQGFSCFDNVVQVRLSPYIYLPV